MACYFTFYQPNTEPSRYPIVVAEQDGVVHVYEVHPEDDPSPMRGFGGRRWRITWGNGTTLETTNLWHCGEAGVGSVINATLTALYTEVL